VRPFRWQDGPRLVIFGRGILQDVADHLGSGYALLTTPRAAAMAPTVVAAAGSVHEVPSGFVDEIAGDLLGSVSGELIVSLGGGRVIDVGKALVAAGAGERAAALPTTLSAAEMTGIHRQARGMPPDTPRVRPAIVLNDPALSASQPAEELAASTLNALGHAVEGPLTPLANPVATLTAHRAAQLLVAGWSSGEPDRDALALGALLGGNVIDSTGYGLHHVLAQTLVRVAGAGHGPANAVMLPHTIPALTRRDSEAMARLGAAMGGDPAELAAQLTARTGATRLRDLGIEREALEACADAAAERFELSLTPPPADRAELLALYDAAW
jgi:alcohol dehydrogenase class IV